MLYGWNGKVRSSISLQWPFFCRVVGGLGDVSLVPRADRIPTTASRLAMVGVCIAMMYLYFVVIVQDREHVTGLA